MNAQTIMTILLIACGFTIWPILGKFSGASKAWVNAICMGGTGLLVIAHSMFTVKTEVPSIRAVLLMLAGAGANAAAVTYYVKAAVDPKINTGLFVVAVGISMAILAPIADLLINGSSVTLKQGVGISCGLLAIYLLS